jgi:DNA-binding CsgD family transcriptional regulator
MELHRIVPAMVASLEYEWITSKNFIAEDALAATIKMTGKMGNIYENSAFAFWLKKARNKVVSLDEVFVGYKLDDNAARSKAIDSWRKAGCPYELALGLFDGSDDDKRKAVSMMQELGATAVYEKMKYDLRKAGVKKIPRGARKTTQSNAAQLTNRELEILQLINEGLQNKEIASRLFISAKTVDHHITSILYKLEVNSRAKAVHEAIRLEIIK